MEKLIKRHLDFWTNKTILWHMFVSVLLLAVSLFITYFALKYTNNHSGDVVSDILLDSLPVVNVAFLFFQGAFIFVLILFGVLMFEPKYIPFVLESSALFFLTRSLFMIMTHLSPPSVEYYNYIHKERHVNEVLFTVSSGNDLFFSAHAGYPFLLALVFWRIRFLRYFFLLCSLIGSVVVILGHLHYSIDVFSSFFIAFGVYEITKFFFKKGHNLLDIK